MKAFRYMKHGKEYRKELFASVYFWIGVVLIISAIVLGYLQIISYVPQLFIMLIGLFLIFGMKQRILGRFDEKYGKK